MENVTDIFGCWYNCHLLVELTLTRQFSLFTIFTRIPSFCNEFGLSWWYQTAC